jgi:predicted restriction endonuclease
MMAAGIKFLNGTEYLSRPLRSFNSVEDIILARNVNRERNQSNNSSYVTKGGNHVIQIYGKTYGANKYETTLFCVAFSRLSNNKIELYQICEQDLKAIPQRCADVINSLGNVSIIQTDLKMERSSFEKEDSLRSPRYIYNLLSRLGAKKCAFCDCEIPELIQGAHIWPVAKIKREAGISLEQKLNYATDGNNGIWLCENHHKMLDEDIITIDVTGAIRHNPEIAGKNMDFIKWSTPVKRLKPHVMTGLFITYLTKRYGLAV